MKLICKLSCLLLIFGCTKSHETTLPTERVLVESVYSSVTIQPDSLYQAYAIVAGILDHILVEQSDLLFSNQRLIQIINNTPKLNAQNAKLIFEVPILRS